MWFDQEIDAATVTVPHLAELHRNGRHAHLVAAVEQIARERQPSAAEFGLVALALADLQRYDEAAAAVDAALTLAPKEIWLFGVNAVVRWQRNQGDDRQTALAALERAMQLRPDAPGYAALLARYRRCRGDLAGAVRAAEMSLVGAGEHPAVLNELGLAEMELGAETALARFTAARRLQPEAADSYYNEGLLRLRQGQTRQARALFRAAVRRSPGCQAAEEAWLGALAGGQPLLGRLLANLAAGGRVGLLGWTAGAFGYYLLFRLLQLLWKGVPQFYPLGRVILTGALVALMLWLVGGRLVRWWVRGLGPPYYRADHQARTATASRKRATSA